MAVKALPLSPGGLRSPSLRQVGGYSREATGSRPSPHSGLGSRSAPRGSWCAGHSPCLCGETGNPGGRASSLIQSPPCPPSDTAPQPSTCSHGGSNARGLSSRQPVGGMGERQMRMISEATMWDRRLLPTLTPSHAPSSSSGMESDRAGVPPAGQAEDRGAKQQESDHPPGPRHCPSPSKLSPSPHTSGAGQQPHSPDES